MTTYPGSCHCGKVTFEIDTQIERVTLCDCSVCTKKGVALIGVPDDEFRLLSGEADLSLYQFGSGEARHWFCSHCGIHTHGRPRNNPLRHVVNARCLDAYEAIMADVPVRHFDGKNHPKDRGA